MKIRNLLLISALAATAAVPGCKDDPLTPPTKGNLKIVVRFDTTGTTPVVRVAGEPLPEAIDVPEERPSFSAAAVDGGEVWIVRDGSTVQNFTLQLQGSELRGTSSELDAGTYQLIVAALDGGLVTYYGEGSAAVSLGQDREATVTLRNFRPSLTLADTTLSVSAPLSWSLGNVTVDGYLVQFSNNAGFSGADVLNAPSTTRTTTFPVDVAGLYFARVRAENSYVGTRGAFSDVASTRVLEDTIPSGDASGTAPMLGFAGNIGGTSLAGLNILPAGDSDWFSVNACALDFVTVTVRTGSLNPASDLDAMVQLVDSDGTTILLEDQSSGQQDKVVAGSAPRSDTFFITVGARPGAASSIGEYQLGIDVTPGPITDTNASECIFRANPIVYATDQGGDWELFVRNDDGSSILQLTDNAADDYSPVWSPAGDIAWASRQTGDWEIWFMGADGSNPQNLTNSPGTVDVTPGWHPDESRISFTRISGGDRDVYVMPVNAGAPYNFTNDPASDQGGAVFTPDGTRIVYWSEEDGDRDIYIVDADGANKQNLTNNDALDQQPRVSWDGTRIAYVSDAGGSQSVWIMSIDGSNQTDLTGSWGGGNSTEYLGSWDPDGTVLVIETNAFSGDPADFDNYVANVDGTGTPIPLTNGEGYSEGFADWQFARAAVKSDLMTVAVAYPDTVFLHNTDQTAENRFQLRVDNAGAVAYMAFDNLFVDLQVNDVPQFAGGTGLQLVASLPVPNMIPAGESRALADVFMPPVMNLSAQYLDPGRIYFRAEADPGGGGGVINESNETNNVDSFAAWGAYRTSGAVGQLFFESVDAAGDTLDLYISEDNVTRGLLVSAIPDVGSTVDTRLELISAAGFFGGNNNHINGVFTNTGVAELGDGRPIVAGELVALPVVPAGGPLRTSIEVKAQPGTAGDFQLNVQRCELAEIGTAAAGGSQGSSLVDTDCVMWPNPISGAVTYARMYSFTAQDGDEVRIDLTSTDFDATLFLFGPDGNLWSSDDDGAGAGDSRLIETLNFGAAGTWTVVASSFNEYSMGAFSVTVSPIVNTVTPIVFAGTNAGVSDIYVRSPDGLTFTNLTNDAAADAGPVWSPDGSRIVFYSSDRDNPSNDIYVMDADGSNVVNLTNNPGSTDARPSWSPDGSRIAFRSDRDGDGEIYVMNADGSALWNFSSTPGSTETGPVFSPDGSQLLYYSDADGDFEVIVQDLDGANRTQLTTNDGSDIRARFSPDGSMIAWTGDLDIWVMNSDGTNKVNLTGPQFAGASEVNPTWNQDGSMIAFRSNLDNPGGGLFHIYTMNVDGTNVRRVSDGVTHSIFPNWQKPTNVGVDLVANVRSVHDTLLVHPDGDSYLGAQMEAQISNLGAVAAHLPASQIDVDWILSGNSTFGDGDDQIVATQGIPNLVRAGADEFPGPFTLDAGVFTPEYGLNHVRVWVDRQNQIAEVGDGNNWTDAETQLGLWLRDYDDARRLVLGTTGDPLDDPGDLIVDEVSTGPGAVGLLVSAIADVGSGIDPILRIVNQTGSFGGVPSAYDGVITATSVPELGNARDLTGGELVAVPVAADGGLGFTRTAITVSGANNTGGGYQLSVQRCQLVDLGAGAATVGVSASDSLRDSDCVMWPNPMSGMVTYARMYTFDGVIGDELILNLISSDMNQALFLFPPSGDWFRQDDDAGGPDSRIGITLDETGSWILVVSSWNEYVTGQFDLTVVPAVPTGTPVVFTGKDGNNREDIFVRSGDGLTVTNLTNSPTVNEDHPSWSPDGTKIAFSAWPDGSPLARDVFIMDADGANVVNLTNNPGAMDHQPAWSPDGTRIVFISGRDGGGESEVYMMNADGSGAFKFWDSPGTEEWNPEFAPDGSRVVFRTSDGNTWDLLAVDLDGSSPVQLTSGSFNETPEYSPDGTMIAWANSSDGSYDIWVMEASGANARNVTGAVLPSPYHEANPSWNSDGTRLTFDSEVVPNGTIHSYVIDVDGSNLRRLSDGGLSGARQPHWQKPTNVGVDLVANLLSVHDTLLVHPDGDSYLGSQMEAQISNYGAVAAHLAASQIDVDWILSGNSTFGDGDDQIVTTQGIPNLVRAGADEFPGPFTLDAGLFTPEYGLNHVRVWVDRQNQIAEIGDGNNWNDAETQIGLWLQDPDIARRFYVGTTGNPLDDPGDLIVDEVSLATGRVGLLVSAIPDIGSGIDPSLEIRNSGFLSGGSNDNINNVTTITTVPELGNGRVINGGELYAFTVDPDGSKGFTRTSVVVSGANNTQGSYQVNVQRCPLVELGDVGLLGVSVTDSVRSSACVLWPNPISGAVTFARMYTFSGVQGLEYQVDLLSTEFDATLFWFRPNGKAHTQNDDGGEGSNSRDRSILDVSGPWTLVVSTYEELTEGQFQLVVSPLVNTGTDVAFTGIDVNGQRDLYRRSGDGRTYTRLTNDAAYDSWPVWSPDGSRLAFQSDRDDPSGVDVFVMNADGSNVVNLTNNPGFNDYRTNWSPDGTRIAFTSNRDGDSEVYLMNADGTGAFNLTSAPGSNETTPMFSPDGSRMLYITDVDGDWELVTVNLDGAGYVQLTNNTSADIRPRYSPDGSRIAWSSTEQGSYDIWVMNADGSNQVNLTGSQYPNSLELNPNWSPDGSQILFASNLHASSGGFTNLYVMDADGTNVRRISDGYTDSFTPNWQVPLNVATDLVISYRTGHDTLFVGDGAWKTVGPSMEAVTTNNGQVAAFAPSPIEVQWTISRNDVFGDGDDETPFKWGVANQINPGQSVSTGQFDFDPNSLTTIDFGLNEIRVWVDPGNAVPESNDVNNAEAFFMPVALWLQDGDGARRFQTGTTGLGYDDIGNDLFVDEVSQDAGLLVSVIEDIGSGDNPAIMVSSASFAFGERDYNDINGIVTNTTVAELGNGRSINSGELAGFPVLGSSGQSERVAVEVANDAAYQVRIERCLLESMTVGDSMVGALTLGDCVTWPNMLSGSVTYGVMFAFDAQVGDQLTATVGSDVFDPVLIVFDPNGAVADAAGAQGQGTASVSGTVTNGGTHVALVTTWGEMMTGNFWLTVKQPVNTGSRIAYASVADGDWEIYVRSPDGATTTQLTANATTDYEPVWSPAGSNIAFTSNRTSGWLDVFVMNPDGSSQVNLTNRTGDDYQPFWSPDGSRIGFTRRLGGSGTEGDIYSINPDGSGLLNLTNDPGSIQEFGWFSPDGTRLAYGSIEDGDWEIFAVNLDGSNKQQLTSNNAADSRPRYSPDGTRILYTSDVGGGSDIWVMNSDGTVQTNLTGSLGAGATESYAAWSPDGNAIVFNSDFAAVGGQSLLFVMNADGTNVRGVSELTVSDAFPDWEPVGSP